MRRGLVVAGVVVLVVVLAVGALSAGDDKASVCRGTPARGSLEHGWKLPRSGPNFRAYSDAGWIAGRTYVHSAVHQIVVASYAELGTRAPDAKLVYGETGWQRGGKLRPHRTHQNGLSVDFMVPLLDARGRPVEIETNATNRWGYDVELDREGRGDGVRIDFETLALHLALLDQQARARGFGIAKLIFAPELQKKLEATRHWSRIAKLPFMKKPAWVRHDEHYHVDFAVPCGR